MNILKRLKAKRKFKKDTTEYHHGYRDCMTVADHERKELLKTYNKKLEKKDKDIRELKETIVNLAKQSENMEQKYIKLDSALVMILKSAEIRNTMQNNKYKNIVTTVDIARTRIARILKKLPKVKQNTDRIVNRVL